MLDDHLVEHGFDRLPVFRQHVSDGFKLELEYVVGAAFVFVERQRIERDMQGFGEPDQGFRCVAQVRVVSISETAQSPAPPRARHGRR